METETESRYLVPDRAVFEQLKRLDTLGRFALQPLGTVKLVDRYMDTKGRALLRQGWACRLRAEDGSWLVTLKGPKELRGAVLSRPELEVSLDQRRQNPADWPESAVRSQVIELTGGLPLRLLLSIRQTRRRFLLLDGPRRVAELSLDVVHIETDGLRQERHMLECELRGGRVEDLEALHGLFTEQYGLIPETRSKLQMALEIELGCDLEEGAQAPQELTVEALAARHAVNLPQAEHVATLLERLAEGLAPLHHLPPERWPLLRQVALLYRLGDTAPNARRQRITRDLLLWQPIEGLKDEERLILASAAYLVRKPMTAERLQEACLECPSETLRRDALTIAALLRIADGLNHSHTQSTALQSITLGPHAAQVVVSGPSAREDARSAQARADLWQMLFGLPLRWQICEPAPPLTPTEGESKKIIPLRPDDTMRQAAHKILRFHLERMLAQEEGTRRGEDPEALHDMRVATRRLRSALRLLRVYLNDGQADPCRDRLRELACALGRVRDLDVALDKARSYAAAQLGSATSPAHAPSNPGQSLALPEVTAEEDASPVLSTPELVSLGSEPEPEITQAPPAPADNLAEAGLAPLLESWKARRAEARQELLTFLNGEGYQELLAELQGLVQRAGCSELSAEVETVAEVVPQFVTLYWRMVRAYAPLLESAPIELLHALRIDSKRLRYALEFFSAILPEKVVEITPLVTALQDHLGEMHDAAVALGIIDRWLEQQPDVAPFAGVMAYREARRQERDRLIRTLPQVWEPLMRPQLKRRMAALVKGQKET